MSLLEYTQLEYLLGYVFDSWALGNLKIPKRQMLIKRVSNVVQGLYSCKSILCL